MSDPIMLGSERSEIGLPTGIRILREGGSALDAVEAAMRCCEDNSADHYVGTGGLPNARGEVELDASIMIGSSRAFAAVAALQGFPNPISVARAVLERLPQHCVLTGEGARTFATECGFAPAELITDESKRLFSEALSDAGENVEGDRAEGSAGDRAYRAAALDLVRRLAPHDGPWGTINIIALDRDGELVAGVSTSGYPWKYPGRVGDSALPGAGIWCDLRIGAAACTGRGELSLRAGTARSVVDEIGRGADVEEACRAGLVDAATLPDDFRAELRVLALTPDGRHGGCAGVAGSTYAVMTADHDQPEIRARGVL